MTIKEKSLYTIIMMQTIIIVFNNIAHEFLKKNNSFLGFILILLALIMVILASGFTKIIRGAEEVE
jgi:hypothetical protein